MDQFDNIDYQEQNQYPQYHTKSYRYQTTQSTSCKTDPEDNRYLICTQKSSDGNNNYQRTYKKQIYPQSHHNNFFNQMQQMRSFPAHFAFNAITQKCQNDPEDNQYLLCTQTKNNGNGKQTFTFRKPKLEMNNSFSQFRPFSQFNGELKEMSKGMEQIDKIVGLLGGGLFNMMNMYSDYVNPLHDSNYHENNFANYPRQSFPQYSQSQQYKNTQHKNSPYNFSWDNSTAQEMKDI